MPGPNDPDIRDVLNPLSAAQRLALMLLLCERMMPGLQAFADQTGFDATIYKTCVASAWAKLAGEKCDADYAALAEDCLARAPDTEDSDSPLVSPALNAALSIAAMMTFIADGNTDQILQAMELDRDTTALRIQIVESKGPRSLDLKHVLAHPLMQQKRQQQADDLAFVLALPADGAEMIRLLRQRAATFAV
jgi:uncharacterized protein YjaG (DUF416 family)